MVWKLSSKEAMAMEWKGSLITRGASESIVMPEN